MGFVPRACLFGLAGFFFSALAAGAQTSEVGTPAHIAFVEGDATIDRENYSEPAVSSMPLVAGDRLRTDRGRLEVLFPDGSSLALDEFSSIELQAPTLFRVTSGRILLTVAGAANPASAAHFQIDTPTSSATTDGPGEYRVAILSGPTGAQTELAILRGSGALMTERGSTPLRAGERSVAWENDAPSEPQGFNSARFDAFDRWASARRDARLGRAASTQHLPADLRVYGGALDRGGSWQYEAAYGNVWYPTVSADWRPYYHGYWSTIPYYGWTWIGLDVWAWPTHHYGRWGHLRNRWFWIPGNRWGPAWVSWGAAPGYVSWSPLGFDNRPVFGLSVGVGDQRAGWVTVSRSHFGRGRYANRHAVAPRGLPGRTPFVVQGAPPVAPSVAVPRANASRGVAVPRNRAGGGRPGRATEPRSFNGTTRDDRGGSRASAVGRQPGTAGVSTGSRGLNRRQAAPDAFKDPFQAGSRAVPRAPDGQGAQPIQPGHRGVQPIHPAYQVQPARPAHQRRAPGRALNPSAGPTQPVTTPPARGPARSPYMLSAPLGPPPQSPSARPLPARPGAASPAPRAVPQTPGAIRRSAPFGSPSRAGAPAQAAPARSAPAARSPQASPRRAAPAAAAPSTPHGPPPAPRQRDPASRRPR